jgi:hypothetical protein
MSQGQSPMSQREEAACQSASDATVDWLQASAGLKGAIRRAQEGPGLGEKSSVGNLDEKLDHARNMINQLSDYAKIANAVRDVATFLVYIDQDLQNPNGRAAALRVLSNEAYDIRVPGGPCGPLDAAAACRDSAALLRRATALI